MIATYQTLIDKNITLKIINQSDLFNDLIELTGANRILEVEDDEE
jgi:hypothetical protein